eukprot:CAMPEP_0183719584 /NCGR_PEP_ID=MMETSP0737-20130205/12451_1 /TAXON_ID=385413 /ORGANISM="Thalassiosira miniscula, Strain CCMP1093" /LENGTH=229 /DNA_ID=CAMNT_0025949305 /DNA_START=1 /DNA_END=690 /DNA_ORIENTATION=-
MATFQQRSRNKQYITLQARNDKIMRRSLSIFALLGLFTVAAVSGFSAPRVSNSNSISTATTARRQSRLFPFSQRTTSSTCQPSSIVTTRMTSDDNSKRSEEATESKSTGEASAAPLGTNGDAATVDITTTAAAAAASTTSTSTSNESKGSGGGGFSLILLPTLLFKFTIVMCVKFATDIVVFPLLWLYRLARLGKRKVVGGMKGLFGGNNKKEVEEVKGVNGDSSATFS